MKKPSFFTKGMEIYYSGNMGILFVDMIIFCLTGIGRKDNQEILTRRAATMWLCRRKMHVKIGKNYPAEK